MPITESTAKEGYTDITYLTTFSLKFLDAHGIEGSKVPLKFGLMASSGSESGFRYLFLYSKLNFKPYKSKTEITTIKFKIKSDNKTMSFEVKPENR